MYRLKNNYARIIRHFIFLYVSQRQSQTSLCLIKALFRVKSDDLDWNSIINNLEYDEILNYRTHVFQNWKKSFNKVDKIQFAQSRVSEELQVAINSAIKQSLKTIPQSGISISRSNLLILKDNLRMFHRHLVLEYSKKVTLKQVVEQLILKICPDNYFAVVDKYGTVYIYINRDNPAFRFKRARNLLVLDSKGEAVRPQACYPASRKGALYLLSSKACGISITNIRNL